MTVALGILGRSDSCVSATLAASYMSCRSVMNSAESNLLRTVLAASVKSPGLARRFFGRPLVSGIAGSRRSSVPFTGCKDSRAAIVSSVIDPP